VSPLYERLRRLFERYNRLYWQQKLPHCRVIAARLQKSVGRFDPRNRTIKIDVAKHRSDRELRSTLLHEMCHVAAHRAGSRGHDAKFFEQMEQLLRKSAPVTINNPEAAAAHIFRDIIPSRFPLLKHHIERVEARRRRAVEQTIRAAKSTPGIIRDEQIIRDFETCCGMELEESSHHHWSLLWLNR
jgi:predicted SprT family Zn-dependent metalloprotease